MQKTLVHDQGSTCEARVRSISGCLRRLELFKLSLILLQVNYLELGGIFPLQVLSGKSSLDNTPSNLIPQSPQSPNQLGLFRRIQSSQQGVSGAHPLALNSSIV